MQQSAKKARNKNNKSSLPEVFPLTAGIAGSGKTMPFEKRHAGCEEREKINRRRIYDTLRINFEATKRRRIFQKGRSGNDSSNISEGQISERVRVDRVRSGKVRGEGEDDEGNKRSSGRDSEESSIYGLPFYGDSARRCVWTRAERRARRREKRVRLWRKRLSGKKEEC
ncbi:hypothetical protein [Treponema vincentii]|uniref:hypothetical protein n=1 Tax=Treponema vincentii TaxID=69710 RepID=UPI00193A1C3B|nr:hypothetical protein [Treponema vincentii]